MCPFKVCYFFQPFRKTGWFVLLIGNLINDIVMFLFLAFIVMVGFALAFFVMYRMVNPEDAEETAEYFQSLHYSILQLFVSLAGNFEIEVLPALPSTQLAFSLDVHRDGKALHLHVHDIHLRHLLCRRGYFATESFHRNHGRHLRQSQVHRIVSAARSSCKIHQRLRNGAN